VHGLDIGEAGLGEHLPRGLFSLHDAEAHRALGEVNSHAVHARDGVQEQPERVV